MNRQILTASAAIFLLSGCGTQDGGANQAASTSSTNAADMTPEGPSLTAKLFGGGKPMPLDIQRQAANGLILYVTSIQAKPTETVLAVKIVNGAKREVELNWSDQKTFLTAQGQRFFLSPPIENKDLKIGAGATLQGELIFLGRLPQEGQVALVFNDGQSDSQYSSYPNLSIPLPVTTAAFTDDGSKKNSAA